MKPLLRLTVANIKSFTRDRAALFWTLAFPLIFVILFGSIFSGGSNQRSIGFADLDASPASAQLAAAFRSIDGVQLVDGTEDDLVARMKKGELSSVIVVPTGFGATVASKAGTANVTVYTDPSQASADGATRQLVGFVLAGAAQFAAVGLIADGSGWPSIVLLTALLNARHLLYSAAIAPWLGGRPRLERAAMAHVLTDETFALSLAHFQRSVSR